MFSFSKFYVPFVSAGELTYDKSTLTEQWREISSRENMETVDYDDDDYYDEYDEDDDRKKEPSNKRNGQSPVFRRSDCVHLLLALMLTLICAWNVFTFNFK